MDHTSKEYDVTEFYFRLYDIWETQVTYNTYNKALNKISKYNVRLYFRFLNIHIHV